MKIICTIHFFFLFTKVEKPLATLVCVCHERGCATIQYLVHTNYFEFSIYIYTLYLYFFFYIFRKHNNNTYIQG